MGVDVSAPVWSHLATLTSPSGLRSNSLTLTSTSGLVDGNTIALGDATAPPSAVAVVASVDGPTGLTLSAPLAGSLAQGSAVRKLVATLLQGGATAGQTDVQVATAAGWKRGDLVALTDSGKSEVAMIDGAVDAMTLRLSRKLQGDYSKGALLRRQTTGLSISAISPGNWANRLRIDAIPRTPAPWATRFNLIVTLAPGPDQTQPPESERFLDLSLGSTDPRYAPTIVNSASILIRLTIPQGLVALRVKDGVIPPFPIALAGGRDGLSDVTAADFIGGVDDFRGLRVLEEVDEIGILVAPDAVNEGQTALVPKLDPPPDPCAALAPASPPDPVADDPTAKPQPLPAINGRTGAGAVYWEMVEQAARLRYRVALLDTRDNLEPTAANAWLTAIDLPPAYVQFSAVYYPWVHVPDGLTGELATRRVPPAGQVAGVYAHVDNSSCVQHPPANIELQFAVDLVRPVLGPQHGQLNEWGINALRSFPGRGLRVWGARSLAAAFDDQEQWWFIHVRRTMSMIENSVEKAMQWTVFETNNANLRRTLTHSLSVFLEQIWRSGGLKGAKASHAFYVKCDDSNNPQSQIDRGWLVCEVGVAIAAPMEFLTFQIQRQPDGTGVVEA
jgi:hypothetical protein